VSVTPFPPPSCAHVSSAATLVPGVAHRSARSNRAALRRNAHHRRQVTGGSAPLPDSAHQRGQVTGTGGQPRSRARRLASRSREIVSASGVAGGGGAAGSGGSLDTRAGRRRRWLRRDRRLCRLVGRFGLWLGAEQRRPALPATGAALGGQHLADRLWPPRRAHRPFLATAPGRSSRPSRRCPAGS
jgi:hypothetical protein